MRRLARYPFGAFPRGDFGLDLLGMLPMLIKLTAMRGTINYT